MFNIFETKTLQLSSELCPVLPSSITMLMHNFLATEQSQPCFNPEERDYLLEKSEYKQLCACHFFIWKGKVRRGLEPGTSHLTHWNCSP